MNVGVISEQYPNTVPICHQVQKYSKCMLDKQQMEWKPCTCTRNITLYISCIIWIDNLLQLKAPSDFTLRRQLPETITVPSFELESQTKEKGNSSLKFDLSWTKQWAKSRKAHYYTPCLPESGENWTVERSESNSSGLIFASSRWRQACLAYFMPIFAAHTIKNSWESWPELRRWAWLVRGSGPASYLTSDRTLKVKNNVTDKISRISLESEV